MRILISQSQSTLDTRWQQFMFSVVCVIFAGWAAATFVVNNTDNRVQVMAIEATLRGESPYDVQGFFGPPHGLLLMSPFVLWGARVAAFINLLFILLIMTSRKNWGTAIILLTSPPLLFVAASANISGIVTGLGLVLLLTRQRGVVRGIAWAYLTIRPQDALLLGMLDGFLALRQRDWTAIITATVLMLPTFIFLPLWLEALPSEPPLSYTFSIVYNYGWIKAILLFALISLIRIINLRPLRWRNLSEISYEEFLWLLTLAWLFVSPHVVVYMLWISIALPIRHSGIVRVLIFWTGMLFIGATYWTDIWENDRLMQGYLIFLGFCVLLAPRSNVPPEDSALAFYKQP